MTPATQETPRPRRRCDGCGVTFIRAYRPLKKQTGRRVCLDCAELETGKVSAEWDA